MSYQSKYSRRNGRNDGKAAASANPVGQMGAGLALMLRALSHTGGATRVDFDENRGIWVARPEGSTPFAASSPERIVEEIFSRFGTEVVEEIEILDEAEDDIEVVDGPAKKSTPAKGKGKSEDVAL